MSSQYVSKYLSSELEKHTDSLTELNEAESLLLTCGYQRFLRLVIEEAKIYARRDGSKSIMPRHIKSARDALIQD